MEALVGSIVLREEIEDASPSLIVSVMVGRTMVLGTVGTCTTSNGYL